MQDLKKNKASVFALDDDYFEASKSPLYTLLLSKKLSTDEIIVEIHSTRMTLIRRSKLGFWEHKETFSLNDIGDIIVIKGMFSSTIEIGRRNTPLKLLSLTNVPHNRAEEFKVILNLILIKRQKNEPLTQAEQLVTEERYFVEP